MFKYGVISGRYFPALGLNTERYEVFTPNAGKYGPETTPYLDTFHVVILNENQLLEAVQKKSSSAPVLKVIRKWNACEEENFYFKDFLVTGSQYLYSRLFQNRKFLLQVLPTAWEYSMFLPLTKATRLKYRRWKMCIKSINVPEINLINAASQTKLAKVRKLMQIEDLEHLGV